MHYSGACCCFSVEACQHISVKLLPILQNPVQSPLPQRTLFGPFIRKRITTSCLALPEHIIRAPRGTQQGRLVLPRKEDRGGRLPERRGIQAETERRGRQRAVGKHPKYRGLYARTPDSPHHQTITFCICLSVACAPAGILSLLTQPLISLTHLCILLMACYAGLRTVRFRAPRRQGPGSLVRS